MSNFYAAFRSIHDLGSLTAGSITDGLRVVVLPPITATGPVVNGLVDAIDFQTYVLANTTSRIVTLEAKPGNGAFVNPITMTLTGPVTGNVSFDGSGNVSMAMTIVDGAVSMASVAGLSSSLAGINTDLTTAEGNITTLQGNIVTIRNEIVPSTPGYLAGANANNATTSGFYALQSPSTNTPTLDCTTLLYVGGISDQGFQLANPWNTPNDYYARSRYGTGWRVWNKFWHDGNLNPASYAQLSTANFTGPVSAPTLTSNVSVLNGSAVNDRFIYIEASGINRWRYGSPSSTESGGNVGSDWALIGFDDTGAYLNSPIVVTRATGAVAFNGLTTVNNQLIVTGLVSAGNGNGTESYRVGNDSSLWDVNIANTMGLKGIENPAFGWIKFGDAPSGFGWDGGKLAYGNNTVWHGGTFDPSAKANLASPTFSGNVGIGVAGSAPLDILAASNGRFMVRSVGANVTLDCVSANNSTYAPLTMSATNANFAVGPATFNSNVTAANLFGEMVSATNITTTSISNNGNGGTFGLVAHSSGSQAAVVTFIRDGIFGAYLGFGSESNDLRVGGWSMGNASYKILHEGLSGFNSVTVAGFSRVYAGWDSGITGSMSCNSWFRSSGQTGFYCSDYAGGWYMTDTTYMRSYNNKAVTASDFVISSDETLKSGIRPLAYKGRLRPINYTLTETGKANIGFSAQEVQKLYPEVVGVIPETGKLQLSYGKLVAVLSHQINTLEDETVGLCKELRVAQNEIAVMHTALTNLTARFDALMNK